MLSFANTGNNPSKPILHLDFANSYQLLLQIIIFLQNICSENVNVTLNLVKSLYMKPKPVWLSSHFAFYIFTNALILVFLYTTLQRAKIWVTYKSKKLALNCCYLQNPFRRY